MWEQHGSQEEVVLHFIRSFHERTKQPDFGEFLTINTMFLTSAVFQRQVTSTLQLTLQIFLNFASRRNIF